MTLDDIVAALRARSPGRTDDAYLTAAIRVYHNLEMEGPISEADRLFLGGPDEKRGDVDILIDRTLLEMRSRNKAQAEAKAEAT